jgi:hypothetical protein
VDLPPFAKAVRPTVDQAMRKPGVRKPPLVNVESPSA